MEDFKISFMNQYKENFAIELRMFFDSTLSMCSLLGIVYYFILKETSSNYN